MDGYPPIVTMYVWENCQPFDLAAYFPFIGGEDTPAVMEFYNYAFKPVLITKDFLIWNKQNGFFTPLLEERLKNSGISLPKHEITFTQRLEDQRKGINMNLDRIAEFGAFISFTQRAGVLVVKGTDLESNPLYASPDITQKLETMPKG